MNRYNAYGPWLKKTFGSTVYKVTVDGGFTCPNRDGTVAWGGCTYCSNDSFRPEGAGSDKSIQQQIANGIEYLTGRFLARKFLVYWQNFTNTYAPASELEHKFSAALSADSRIVGMTIGTRPDCVEDEKLQMLSRFSANYYVCLEFGLESTNDSTLRTINRGHDYACLVDAVERTRSMGFPVCAHVIMGFPGEPREQLLATAGELNRLGVGFVKLHHLHVSRGTRLAKEYARQPFHLFEFEEWVEFVVDFLERLHPSIVMQRLYGWAPDDHLVAPKWRKTKAEVNLAISRELLRRDTWQGRQIGWGLETLTSAIGQPLQDGEEDRRAGKNQA